MGSDVQWELAVGRSGLCEYFQIQEASRSVLKNFNVSTLTTAVNSKREQHEHWMRVGDSGYSISVGETYRRDRPILGGLDGWRWTPWQIRRGWSLTWIFDHNWSDDWYGRKCGAIGELPHTMRRFFCCGKLWGYLGFIGLAHLVWIKATPKWKLKYFENGITLVDGVKTIWLPSIFCSLFRHAHIGIVKNHSSFRQNND